MFDKWQIEESQKICAFDLDGVLNYYPDCWVDYINEHTGNGVQGYFKDLNQAKAVIPYSVYKALKYDYRESGYKATLKVREGAKEVLDELKRRGYQIMLLTSRPFEKHKCLFKQTETWLHDNDLPYDGLIFGENKYVEVLTKVSNLRFLVDDHRYYAMSVSRWGYPTFLVNTIYNKGDVLPNVHRIHELGEILQYDFV